MNGTVLDTYEKVKRAAEKYAGHVLRGTSGLSHLQILEGTVKWENVSWLFNRYE